MKYIEYGREHNEIIMMLHGGGLSYWNYRQEAEFLSAQYHVVLPILDGHNDSDAPFVSIEKVAQRLIEDIHHCFDGRLKVLCGLSLGAQIVLEILSRESDIAEYALLESVSVIPARTLSALIPFSISLSYGLIARRWFSRLQFKSLHINGALYEDYYQGSIGISKADLISVLVSSLNYELKKSVAECSACFLFVVGSKEERRILKSVEKLVRLTGGKLLVKEGLCHGEFSLNYPEEYVEELRKLIEVKR